MTSGSIDTAFLLSISVLGAASDLLTGKIFNWLTLPAMIIGLGFSAWCNGWGGLESSAFAVALAFGVFVWMFAIGVLGAGDVKFLMALGAFAAPKFVAETAVLSIMLGGIQALIVLAAKGRAQDFVARMRHFFLTLVLSELEFEAPKIDHSSKMPFGLPIAAAAVWVTICNPFEKLGVGIWPH